MLMYEIMKKPQWMQLRGKGNLDIIVFLQTYIFRMKYPF